MKKVLLLLIIIVSSFASFGQNEYKKWGIGAGINTDPVFEIYTSRYINPSFDVFLKQGFDFYRDAFYSGANIRYKFYNDNILPSTNTIQPYIFTGPMLLLYDSFSVGLNIGAGSKFIIKDNAGIYLNLEYGSGKYYKVLRFMVGVELSFGY